MNLSTWAIRNPVPAIALFLVACIVGLVSFGRMPVTRFPNIDVPIVVVTASQPGAAPAELVSQVTKPVEDAVAGIPGVKHVTSTTSDAGVEITVEFILEAESSRALDDVRDAVAQVQEDLPEDVEEPIVRLLDVTGEAIMAFAVADPTQSIEALSFFVDDVLARDLQIVDGVGKIERAGGADEAVLVELEPDRLLSLGITAAEVSSQLQETNIDLGGGAGDLGQQRFSIRTLGGADTIEALAATPLAIGNGRTVRLDQLGAVIDGAQEPRTFATLDGQPVVAFEVFRAVGASDTEAAEGVRARVAELDATYPNLSITPIFDTTEYTFGNYDRAMETLYEGAFLAVIVVLAFLRDWRATIVTAVAIPLSIIPTFAAMEALGFSLNIVSLLAITLVTGILVDDAIVEIENIDRHIRLGRTAYRAAEEAAEEIGLTVVAISLTIVAVFAPVSFMSGIAGQYFKQFGLTVAVAVLFSLLVARLITPMFAAYFLRDHTHPEPTRDGWLMRLYLRLLGWSTRHQAATLAIGLAVFAASLYSATLLPSEFVPRADESRSIISVELPPGATLDDTRESTDALAERLLERPEVTGVFVSGGTGDLAKARVTVNYLPPEERALPVVELERALEPILRDLPDVRANFLSDGDRDISIFVLGDTEAASAEAAAALAADMSTLPELRNVTNASALARPEIRVRPIPEIAAELGVTASTIARTVRIATAGDSEGNLAKFTVGDRQIPVVVRIKEEVREDLFRMQGIRIPTALGTPVPLFVVAEVEFATGPGTIERYDQKTRTELEADLAPGAVLGPALERIHALPTGQAMPEGTTIQQAGDAEVMGEVFGSFALAMGTGILLVYVVLVLLFSSFLTPVTILMSLPLSIGGAIGALFLANYAIGLSVVIGFLMLMGIVTKNAIMLVEFALQAMQRGMTASEAVIDAGHKRARPIVMTTIAMTAGMVPSALGFGAGGEFRSPMAVAVIGGLLVSTLLSLIFVPALFSALEALRAGVRRLPAALARLTHPGLGAERRAEIGGAMTSQPPGFAGRSV